MGVMADGVGMEYKTSLIDISGTKYLLLPKEWVSFLSLEVGQEKVILKDYEKSKGRFIAVWKNEEKTGDSSV